MFAKINKFLDKVSEFFAHRKGLIPLLGIICVIINFIFQFFPQLGWVVTSNFMLHAGIIMAIIGFLLAWAL